MKILSSESAVLRVLSDILLEFDRGDFPALVLLDLSAAFDIVDHDILLQRLESKLGIADVVLDWFQSYLSDRTQFVRCGVYDRQPSLWFAKARCWVQFAVIIIIVIIIKQGHDY